jgi:hypothetical protein
MIAELSRREKEANLRPDPDLDVYMKVKYRFIFKKSIVLIQGQKGNQSCTSLLPKQAISVEGQERVITDYTLKVSSKIYNWQNHIECSVDQTCKFNADSGPRNLCRHNGGRHYD